jgi:hypothetical protein
MKSENWLDILEAALTLKLEPLPTTPNPFDVVKVGQWVRYIGNTSFKLEYDTWYQRLGDAHGWFIIKDNGYGQSPKYSNGYGQSPKYSNNWDLTDILDYSPDEEIVLKVGDIVVFEGETASIISINYQDQRVYGACRSYDRWWINFSVVDRIHSVNGKRGKFVIPPLPAFDFEKYLLEKDIVVDDDIAFEIVIDKKHTIHCNNGVKRNKANADRLIAAANMLGELE